MNLKVEIEFSHAFQSRLSLERQILLIEEDRSTVKHLFDRLAKEHGEKIKPLLFAPKKDEILSGLMIMVNDKIITGNDLNQQNVQLSNGDKVSLLYFISGG